MKGDSDTLAGLILEYLGEIPTKNTIVHLLDINFLHFALFLFLICAGILMLVSKLTTPQSMEALRTVTFQKKDEWTFKFTKDVTLTILLILCVLMLWLLFSPWGIA